LGRPIWPRSTTAWSGTLSTAGNLIFATDLDGYMFALDAKTGALLWRFNLGSPLKGAPITWSVDGRQYVTMGSGAAVVTFALPRN
jgi:alcohol dehydrogenase (cytochrome c)